MSIFPYFIEHSAVVHKVLLIQRMVLCRNIIFESVNDDNRQWVRSWNKVTSEKRSLQCYKFLYIERKNKRRRENLNLTDKERRLKTNKRKINLRSLKLQP